MLPVGDFLRRNSTPYVNWTLIAINVGVFVYMLTLNTRPDALVAGVPTSETDRFIIDWGFVPACIGEFFGVDTNASPGQLAALCPPGDRELIQPITSMFVHAGWAHILSNMLFLWIFGDNIEDRVGHLRYLVFYVLCGLGAAAAQTYVSLDGAPVPAVGASGAIAGVMGAYLMMFPTAMVQVIIFPLFFWPFFVPAAVLIVVWFLTQLLSGFAEIGSTTVGSGVAWWAHVGGFVTGAVLIWFFRRSRRRRELATAMPGFRDT